MLDNTVNTENFFVKDGLRVPIKYETREYEESNIIPIEYGPNTNRKMMLEGKRELKAYISK